MITCRRVVELLIDYVAGEMPPEQRAALDAHFGKCPPCVVYLETYRTTITLTHQLPREVPLPPELERRLIQVLHEAQGERGASAP